MKKLLAIAMLMVLAVPALAQDVVDYNWLQMQPDLVTMTAGSTTGTGGNGYGTPDWIRWGHHVWIPDGAFTGDGTADYWAEVHLDQPRNVKMVKIQWWAGEGTAITRCAVEGSADGENYTQIGTFDFGSPQTGDHFFSDVDVTDGIYQHIRVKMSAGDYVYAKANRGGPGIYSIEPAGDGTLEEWNVNWANEPNFATEVNNNGFPKFNGLRYNDGWLYDDEGTRTGTETPWPEDAYAEIDMQNIRTISRAVLVWDKGWYAEDFSVSYSFDGTTWMEVTGKSAPKAYPGALQIKFDPALGRYFRIINVSGGASLGLINQALFYSPQSMPSPVSVNDFAVADQTTGSTVFTNSKTVDVTAFSATTSPEAVIDGYLITETDAAPTIDDAWQPAPPATYTFSSGAGAVLLYAWAKDDQGNISREKSVRIYYSEQAPAANNVAVAPDTYDSVIVTWSTNMPANGSVVLRAFDGGPEIHFAEDTFGTQHSVTVSGLMDGVDYKLTVLSNEFVLQSVLWPEASSQIGSAYKVVDYNWLQLRPDDVQISIGSTTGQGGSGFGLPGEIRWGGRVWIPDGAFTADGTADYWVTAQLDQPRQVSLVKVQWYATEGNYVKNFKIQASNDGETWTDIAEYDYGAMSEAVAPLDVMVTPTECQYVRLYIPAGGYTFLRADRGGPGLYSLEPAGDAVLSGTELNVANQAFGTTATNVALQFNGKGYSDGWVWDDGPGRAGCQGTWPDGSAIELDFGEVRTIDECVVMWEDSHKGTAYNFEYFDGTEWVAPPNMSAPISYTDGEATGYTFDPVDAQTVRITGATGSVSNYNLLNEIFVYAAEAAPLLDGDANGDCKVNIIDLIYIRNRLNQDPASGDNASADANKDGKINIIDLIYVRNRLNTRCE